MDNNEQKTQHITRSFRLPQPLIEQLTEIADNERRSVNQIVQMMLEESVKEYTKNTSK